ncbi:MAG: bifunctional glutamate N-acetyltransferase/amino-acid acetyltransferase ArgJ [Alphaproteobacteria bacterium]
MKKYIKFVNCTNMSTKISQLAPRKLKKIEIIKGISVSITHCGLKKNNKEDLILIKLDKPADILGVFTKSKTPGEPVIWNKSIIKNGKVSVILVNSGNANVFNGSSGKKSLIKIVNKLSEKLGIPKEEVFIGSTGVIGEPLDERKIIKKIPFLIANLKNDSNSWLRASKAIMTTDTFAKTHSEKLKVGNNVLINGIAKGSGMINPNMATMLSFIFTNAQFDSKLFKSKFYETVDKTFNSITVDSDTSTSDMVLFFSIKNEETKLSKSQKKDFFIHLEKLMTELATMIVKDGEGASKFIRVKVKGARSFNDAKVIAKSIANSPLVKTAIAGSDANWGRVVMAVGKSGVKIDPKKISIKFGKLTILTPPKTFLPKNLSKIDKYLNKKEVEITVSIGSGKFEWTIYTCDFTQKYITINKDYRT